LTTPQEKSKSAPLKTRGWSTQTSKTFQMLAHPQGDIFRSLLSPHHNKRARCLRALFFAGIELFRSLDLDVFRMEYSQAQYLLKIIVFVKGQNLSNAIVFHDDAVNDVPTPEWYLRIPCLT
jgi:hypothetical protein